VETDRYRQHHHGGQDLARHRSMRGGGPEQATRARLIQARVAASDHLDPVGVEHPVERLVGLVLGQRGGFDHFGHGVLAVDDAEQLLLFLGQGLVGVGKIANAEQVVRIPELRHEALLLVDPARRLDESAFHAQTHQGRSGPGLLGLETVASALPAHDQHSGR
jgi:hypothetical protein